MRPTREGRTHAGGLAPITSSYGVDPVAVTEDPEPPTDRASEGLAYIPFVNQGTVDVVQHKTGVSPGGSTSVTITLDSAPTIGNVLVAFIGVDDDGGPTYTLTNGTWTQVGPTVYSGNGTNWPLRQFRQTVTASTAAATFIDSFGGSTDTGTVKAVIVELAGADIVDADIGSATNTATTTDSVTPSAGLPAVILSGTFGRNGSAPVLAAAGSMTELTEIGVNRPLAVNRQIVTSTTGSYTVGSTGAAANSSMIAAVFEDTGSSTVAVPAPLTIDDDDATFNSVLEESMDAAGWLWRGTLEDALLIGSITVRLGVQTAGGNTITVQAGNASDYSDATTVATIPFTATGSYTAQDVTDSWVPTAVYRYWQLILTTTSDVSVFEVSLLDPDGGSEVVAEFVGASYASNAGQSFTSGTTMVIVDFEDAIFDPGSDVTTGASWHYTAPEDGYYRVDSRIIFASSTAWSASSERGVLQLFKNTSFFRTLDRRDGYITAGGSMLMTLGGSCVVQLAVGDTIDVRASQNSGSTIALDTNAGNNYIDITMVR